jgi:hypothetical protein
LLSSWALLVTLGLGPAQPSVEWTNDSVCPGAPIELEQAIERYVQPGSTTRVEVEVRIGLRDAGPAGLRLDLELDSVVGREIHRLAALDCELIIDQAAVLIAGAIDPFAYAWPMPAAVREDAAQSHHRPEVLRPRALEPITDADPIPTPAEPPVATEEFREFGPIEAAEPERERDGDRPKPPITGAISVGATGFIGLFPNIGGGAELEGALERGRLRWQTSASGFFGGRFRSNLADVGGDLWAAALMSGLCGTVGGGPGAKRIRVPLCGVAGAGFMHVRAVGTDVARQDIRPLAWVGAEARVLILAREDFAVGVGFGGMAALLRPAWEVQSPGVRFTVPPAMGVLRLTLEARGLRRRENRPRPRS